MESGVHILEHGGNSGYARTGSVSWGDYSLSADVKPSAWGSENDGIIFGARDGGYYSVDIVAGDKLVLGKSVNGAWTVLATTEYDFSSRWYKLAIDMKEGSLSASVNGTALLHATDSTYTTGGIGFESNSPFEVTNVSVVPA